MFINRILVLSTFVLLVGEIQLARASLVELTQQQSAESSLDDQAKTGYVRLGLQSAVSRKNGEHHIVAADGHIDDDDRCRDGEHCDLSSSLLSRCLDAHEGHGGLIGMYAGRHRHDGHRGERRHEDDFEHHAGHDHDAHGYVPIPGVVWLFVSGLLLLSGVARRRDLAS